MDENLLECKEVNQCFTHTDKYVHREKLGRESEMRIEKPFIGMQPSLSIIERAADCMFNGMMCI